MQEARVKRSVEVSAVVTRVNGTVEDLGVIASTKKGNVKVVKTVASSKIELCEDTCTIPEEDRNCPECKSQED